MSIRIANLDPDVPRAAKDCRVCNRRRIRCDRSLPTCKKCDLRGLDCPGYGLMLKWTDSQSTPKKRKAAVTPRSSTSPVPVEATLHEYDDNSSLSSTNSDFSTSSSIVSVPHRPMGRIHDEDDMSNQFSFHPGLSFDPLPQFFQKPAVKQLISHFDRHIASTMAWVDGPDNPWRKIILPLAMESPGLLLAILALSAEHLTLKRRTVEPIWVDSALAPNKYRDRSLQLLAQQLREETQSGQLTNREVSQRSPNSILATMLVLCNLEIVQSNSSLWHVHLKAARTILQRWATVPRTLSDSTSRFLVREYFIFDVFASTTTFSDEPGLGETYKDLLKNVDNTIFLDYLRQIQAITMMERQRGSSRPNVSDPTNLIRKLQESFRITRDQTMYLSRKFAFSQAVAREFGHLVEIYHHAGLIYSYQSLLDHSDAAPYIEQSVTLLLQHLDLMSSRDGFAHDLVWPFFILGTVSGDNPSRQEFVSDKLRGAMQATGFSNCQQALKFLQAFWGTEHSSSTRWTDFGRGYMKNGSRFVVI